MIFVCCFKLQRSSSAWLPSIRRPCRFHNYVSEHVGSSRSTEEETNTHISSGLAQPSLKIIFQVAGNRARRAGQERPTAAWEWIWISPFDPCCRLVHSLPGSSKNVHLCAMDNVAVPLSWLCVLVARHYPNTPLYLFMFFTLLRLTTKVHRDELWRVMLHSSSWTRSGQPVNCRRPSSKARSAKLLYMDPYGNDWKSFWKFEKNGGKTKSRRWQEH